MANYLKYNVFIEFYHKIGSHKYLFHIVCMCLQHKWLPINFASKQIKKPLSHHTNTDGTRVESKFLGKFRLFHRY